MAETKKANTDLNSTQQWMQQILMSKLPPAKEEKVEDFILPSQRLSARRHLQIYRQSYIARLRECMKKQFEALAYTLGEELFQQFADEYLEQYPSENYSLNNLGEKFPAFLEQTRPDKYVEEKESWIDFMIELAQF
ncbi:MAG: putative DNA-binding domain-containing protein, partial [Bacteroidia bacterium]|nr:putative DNA-binding domain-containing protein [Bacteroidia bacterium]